MTRFQAQNEAVCVSLHDYDLEKGINLFFFQHPAMGRLLPCLFNRFMRNKNSDFKQALVCLKTDIELEGLSKYFLNKRPTVINKYF